MTMTNCTRNYIDKVVLYIFTLMKDYYVFCPYLPGHFWTGNKCYSAESSGNKMKFALSNDITGSVISALALIIAVIV